MNLKSKISAAYGKVSKSNNKGEPEPKKKKQVELQSKGYFEGPFAKMKAKKAIRKGETDVAVAVKNPKNKKSLFNPAGTKSVTTFKDYLDNSPLKTKTTKTPYITPMRKTLIEMKKLKNVYEQNEK
jgi:hypothetical protein